MFIDLFADLKVYILYMSPIMKTTDTIIPKPVNHFSGSMPMNFYLIFTTLDLRTPLEILLAFPYYPPLTNFAVRPDCGGRNYGNRLIGFSEYCLQGLAALACSLIELTKGGNTV